MTSESSARIWTFHQLLLDIKLKTRINGNANLLGSHIRGHTNPNPNRNPNPNPTPKPKTIALLPVNLAFNLERTAVGQVRSGLNLVSTVIKDDRGLCFTKSK